MTEQPATSFLAQRPANFELPRRSQAGHDGTLEATRKKLKILVVWVSRDRGECPVAGLGGVAQNGRVFDMHGMLPHSEARMRMCVMQVGKRGRWTYRDMIRWRFLWKFFPWYARELRYRGDFCLGQGCMHWFWEDSDKKERGYCSVAVSRTQNMMWARELEERAASPSAASDTRALPGPKIVDAVRGRVPLGKK
jgi:hypothetical protein